MKKALMAAVVMAGATAWAGQPAKSMEPKVTVCVGPNQDEVVVTDQAQLVADQVFAAIRVSVKWHKDARTCKSNLDHPIFISYSRNTPKDRLPGALAYALPYEGVHIEVFYDRLAGKPSDSARAHILGHVLAHEITHILQGVSRHSDFGVMKARWNQSELAEMERRPLKFTKFDIAVIHMGLEARTAHRAPGTTIPPAAALDQQ